uniref:glucose-1-phosphate adenylyltransferase n=1 Tax=Tanacetum cinerariifolium TaxID=118510 RepID=A0A6L2LDZ3_TANCI|nr:glucose-1-phosphate adenylyltransferase small subunit, chloroplastic/amyloplastic [Tanacetum cinerariifolium]
MLAADVTDSVIGERCVIKNCKIHHSVVGLRSCIGEGAVIEDSLLMGEYSYETDADRELLAVKGSVLIGIGKNTRIKRAIIDKNVRIRDDVKVTSGVDELSALMTMRRSMMNHSYVPIGNNNGDPGNINADLPTIGELPVYNNLGDWKNSLLTGNTNKRRPVVAYSVMNVKALYK